MAKNTRSPLKRGLWIVFFLLLIGAVVFAATYRQEIKDHFSAAGFEPSQRVTEVLSSLRLSEAGERVFLATHPTVDGSQNFNEQCAEVDHSEEGHVLGCFTHDRIHLYDVTDDRVTGIVEVTAAHELLHATFARLGEGDRAALSAKLRQEYDRMSATDPDLKERMSVYEHLSDTAFANELHSVLGTEVRELPGWLERHYEQWFRDRRSIVDAFASYHAVFVDLQNQADSIRSEMKALRADVEARKVAYGDAVDQFNADAADFGARNERFEFSAAPDEFERIRAELEWRRGDLEVTLTGLQADIDRYNALRDQLTALSEVSSDLDQQLNSDLAPVTTRPTE
ncbi:hypothetical protein [Leucobacter luti]|uniref:Uncharacterized protein n=1 Tax=Leucobacter luti TaxID=340320 RepID=A0A4R6RZ41_9MICO|nr:hypothetical protein [Leucobacter luti]QYM76186.1 hypothetical protein K1X41_01480 [Leucobacter luti]TDP92442.1 hypothetical protein EDF62_1652 [Leucobacter luti]